MKKLGWAVFINLKSFSNFFLIEFYLKKFKQGAILKNRFDIIGSTCLLVLAIDFILERSKDFLQIKAEFISMECNSNINLYML